MKGASSRIPMLISVCPESRPEFRVPGVSEEPGGVSEHPRNRIPMRLGGYGLRGPSEPCLIREHPQQPKEGSFKGPGELRVCGVQAYEGSYVNASQPGTPMERDIQDLTESVQPARRQESEGRVC